jgi:hypothetical protein
MRLIFLRLSLAMAMQFLLPVNSALAVDTPDSTTVEVQPTAPAPSVLPPKMVNPLKAKSVTVKLKSAVVFKVENPEIWRGKVLNSKIAVFVAGGMNSAYETYPSLTLRKKGKTSISLTNGKKTYFLKLTVS